MSLGNVGATLAVIGGVAAGAAIGYGQSRLVAAHTAEQGPYVASQVGAGVLGGALATGSAVLGGMMFMAGSFAGSTGAAVAGAAIGVGALGIVAGSVFGMVQEHGER